MAHTASNNSVPSSDRIVQLNEIDQDVAKLVESAGAAVKALTISKDESDEGMVSSRSIEQQKELFTTASSQYMKLLSSIDVELRRQISALEDANILLAETASKYSQPSQGGLPSIPVLDGSANQAKNTVSFGGL